MSRANIPRYSRVSTRFWTDEKSSAWSDRVKLGALYLMTCSHRHLEGIFVLPPAYACTDLRWTRKSWQSTLTVLQVSGFLKWDSKTNVILIVNALRYQSPENPNQSEAALRRIKDLPQTPLLQEFSALALDHCYRKGATPAAQAFAKLLCEQLPNSCRTVVPSVDEQSGPLNLKPQPQPKTKPQSEPLKRDKAQRSVSLRGEGMASDKELSTVGEVLEKWPHLRHTGQIERSSNE